MPRSRSRAHEPVRGSVCFDSNAADLERIDPLTGDAIVTDESRKTFKTVIDRPTLFPGDSVFAVSIDLCGVIVMVWSRQSPGPMAIHAPHTTGSIHVTTFDQSLKMKLPHPGDRKSAGEGTGRA